MIRKMTRRISLVFLGRLLPGWIFLFLSLAGLPAQINRFSPPGGELPGIPESWEIRQKLGDWIHAPVNEARSRIPETFRQNSDGAYVKVRTEENADSFYQLFLIQEDYTFPLARRGNYIIKRDRRDGSFIQVKIFLQNDEGSFIRIFPSQERAVMDVYLLGNRIYESLVLPFSLSRAFTLPLNQVLALTSGRVDWSLFAGPPAGFRGEELQPVIRQIRDRLPELLDCEDGAMDGDGRYVFIENLERQPGLTGGFNCSGFAKWVVDGYAVPLTGRPLDILPLKEKPLELRGNSWSRLSEDLRDPFFGLDWTRNLAVTLESLRNRGNGEELSPEAMDVREVPFFEYREDVGYPVSSLESVLYLLALENPGTFYLGSVNVPFGTGPVIRQHTHVVVLFPWFTSRGDFKVTVLERNIETSLDSLNSRYGSDFVHLVRVNAAGGFQLP